MLRYVFRLGDRMKILKIPQLNVTDDKYHTVIVKREGNRATLQIDYSGKVEGTTGGLHKLLNMGGGSFFTGGLPNVTEVCINLVFNMNHAKASGEKERQVQSVIADEVKTRFSVKKLKDTICFGL